MNNFMKPLSISVLAAVAITLSACGGERHKGDAGEPSAKSEMRSEFKQGQRTLKVAEAFLTAAGSGDGETLNTLMADDFVWHNEGDATIPWIGNWEGKDVVFGEFMPAFGAGLKTTSWTTDYKMASGNQAIFMGKMSAIANNSGAETGEFSWAVRVHVEDEKVKSWNWFEDSFAVSQAYHADIAE
ncbi:MAG: nuclear transport factor 2 family protein [Litorimonas sp.]